MRVSISIIIAGALIFLATLTFVFVSLSNEPPYFSGESITGYAQSSTGYGAPNKQAVKPTGYGSKPAGTSCTDSDAFGNHEDGVNYFVKGNLSFTSGSRTSSATDFCVKKSRNFFGINKYARVASCEAGKECLLAEYNCPTSNKKSYGGFYACPEGCSDGACISTEPLEDIYLNTSLCYIDLEIKEETLNEGENVTFSLVNASSIYGDYSYKIMEYYPGESGYMLQTIDGYEQSLGDYALYSGLYIIAEDFSGAAPKSEIILLNESRLDTMIPYNREIKVLEITNVFNNESVRIKLDASKIKCERTCKVVNESVNLFVGEKCCNEYSPKHFGGEDWKCV